MSDNPKIQQFLDDTNMAAPDKYAILQAARDIVFHQNPAITERFIYGGIMFSLGKDFGGVFVSKNHISFEFNQGYLFDDPEGVLEGAGKFRRHLKLRSPADLVDKNTEFFIKQAVQNVNAQK